MTDEFEDRLRHHLATAADGVHADPDPGAFLDRSSGRSPRRGVVAGGLAALVAVVAGVGVLIGSSVSGTTATASSHPSVPATGGGRAGAALAPAAGGLPDTVAGGDQPWTPLFTRTSAEGVTIRAYSSGSPAGGGCATGTTCTSPPVTVPVGTSCPSGAVCARPLVEPPASTGAGGTSGTGAGAGSSGGANGGATSGPMATTPVATCQQVVVELSTAAAVGTGSVVLPTTAAPAPDTLEVLGSGSFGTPEGGPAGWVAVWVGSGTYSVRLSVGGAVVDTMAPVGGVAVLAVTGSGGVSGATVVGVGQGGATVASVPADAPGVPDLAAGCPVPVGGPPTTTTTAPATTTTAPATTTTTAAPTTTTAPTTPVTPLPAPASPAVAGTNRSATS